MFLKSMNLIQLKGQKKRLIITIFDILIFNLAYWISYNIRDEIFIVPNSNQIIHLAIGNIIFIILYLIFEINKFVTRYFNSVYIKQFIKFLFIFSTIYFSITLIYKLDTVPRSSPILTAIVFFSIVIVSRFLIVTSLSIKMDKLKVPTIVIGEEDKIYNYYNTVSLKNEIEIVAFFSNNKNLIGRKISNINIFSISQIKKFLLKNKIERAVIVSDQFSINKIRKLIKFLKQQKIEVFYHNNNQDSFIEPLSKSIDKISLRQIKFFFQKNSREFNNSSILITGAGGSIGSELCKQIIKFKPSKIILLELSEINLFNINYELEKMKILNVKIVSILGNINNLSFLENVFRKYKPNLVYHAGAIKHVTIAENNPIECVRTNVIGSKNLMDLSRKYSVKKFILISTDKAVNPSNVMGSSKRIAEIILKYNQSKKTKTIFSAVRFGNVANSSGSVFPIWRDQIQKSKKITITDPEATRYLMSIKEAVSLVLDASILAKAGKIFILDMGEPIKIIDLAKLFLKNYGFQLKSPKDLSGQISYEIIGLRPGEKKHEELFYNKNSKKTLNPYIFDSNELYVPNSQEITIFLNKLNNIFNRNNEVECKRAVKRFLIKCN
jgi:FlaA1/EpsC-like NDP-sugar epimerase